MADERTEKQKVQEITDKLEEGLKELFESEKYKTCMFFHAGQMVAGRITDARNTAHHSDAGCDSRSFYSHGISHD